MAIPNGRASVSQAVKAVHLRSVQDLTILRSYSLWTEEAAKGDAGDHDLSPDDFLGTWSSGRCYVNINSSGGNSYSVDVKWSSSAAESRYWTYPCIYDENTGTLVCNGTGSSVNSIYTEDGTETTEQIYTNGSAAFCLDNDRCLVWNDYTEPENNGMTFIR